MGLAATQARFLNLTARKTNVEYQGQQINQQRTSLSNQSSSYYNQLLEMTVPTPPSTDNFTKIVYSFAIPGENVNGNISQITKDANGKYTISFTYAKKATTLNKSADNNNKNISNKDGAFKYGEKVLTKYDDTTASQQHKDTYNAMYNGAEYVAGSEMYYFENNDNTYTYFLGSDVEAIVADDSQKIPAYTWGTSDQFISDNYTGCDVNRDSNNRVISFSNAYNNIAVSTKTEVDNQAYDNAYNEYTYATYLYEQEIQSINATIEIVQGQDKKLELQLKGLDTEQKAISSELDALKGVLDKNMEAFKTFA